MSEAIIISDDKQVESKFFTYEDLQGVINRGGKGMPITKLYDPKEFWDSMGKKFYRAFDKPEKCGFGVDFFVDKLKALQPIKNVLEIGCGFGRIALFLIQSKVTETYTGIDISKEILECSKEYLEPVIKEAKDIESLNGFFLNGSLSDETKKLLSPEINNILGVAKEKLSEKSERKAVDFRDKIQMFQGDCRHTELDSGSFDCVFSSETLQHLNPDDCLTACREAVRLTNSTIILLERWAFPSEHSEPHIWSYNYSQIFSDLGLEILQVTTIAQGLQGVVV